MASKIRGSDNFDSADALKTTGLATAWVNFNGTGTIAIRDQYNVSSLTDVATGIYTLNFTTAMDNTDYVAVATCSMFNSGTENHSIGIRVDTNIGGPATTKTTSAVNFLAQQSNGANVDVSEVSVLIQGGVN